MSQCEGSGRKGLAILRREWYVECPHCSGTFFRQNRRGYWLPDHDRAFENPNPELPWDDLR